MPAIAWNPLTLTDSYKLTHWKQYPPGTERVYSYFESRGGRYPEVVFFGLKYYLQTYLAGRVVTAERIDEAEELCAGHLGDRSAFHRAGWEHILRHHDGRLPVEIRAVAEGTPVPCRHVLMTIENTDPRCYWLPNYLETLLVQVWYGSTVATQSRAMKQTLRTALEETGDPTTIETKLHDFGFRGVSSVETAGVGAAAHLVNFGGTDTLAGLIVAREIYGEALAGHSIPASEHSTITSWGPDHELDAMANMLTQYPAGLVACVSDSFDIFRACSEYWGGRLKDRVLARDGTLVIRPDSGDPPVMVVKVLELLGDKFGVTVNSKGYKVLPPQVRVIQGDGIDAFSLGKILGAMRDAGWSADNVAFGSGGGLLQKLDRDTQKFAFKCSAACVRGAWRPVFKDPVTDPGKRSKTGVLKLTRRDGTWATETALPPLPVGWRDDDELRVVFRDGEMTADGLAVTFADVRRRAALPAGRIA